MFSCKHSFNLIIFFILINVINLFPQKIYPADTVFASTNTSFAEKVFVTPISLWQRFSYNVPFIGCQFYPSCSNYGAQSISKHGVLVGTALASDRIIRCNPFAFHYHLEHKNDSKSLTFLLDGRMVDEVPNSPFPKSTRIKSPILATSLSAVIPGAGRVYAKRGWDGFFGFLIFILSLNASYRNYEHNNTIGVVVFGFSTMAFYAGEILGAYRAAAEFSDKHY